VGERIEKVLRKGFTTGVAEEAHRVQRDRKKRRAEKRA
jgi:hypothetical protein